MHKTYSLHHRVNLSEAEDLRDSVHDTFARRRGKALTRTKDVFLICLASIGLVAGGYGILQNLGHGGASKSSTDSTFLHKSCYCGESTAEARQRGCKYSSMSAAWLPDHCRDDELTAEFERLGDGPDGNWLYWADKNHTHPLTVDQVAALGDDPSATFHMSADWHVVHCFFLWRLEHRSRFNGKSIEGRFDNEQHILHCMKVAQNLQHGTKSGVSLAADT